MKGITPVILAGGLGTRLEPVIGPHAKVLTLVAGRPFLSYMLDQVIEAGARRVVLCVGFAAAEVGAQMGTEYKGASLHYSEEVTPLDTAGALRHAMPLIRTETALVLNGDSYYDGDLAEFVQRHRERRGFGSMALARRTNSGEYGQVTLDSSDRITGFIEKKASASPGWVNAGVYLLHRSLLERIPRDGAVSLERQMFRVWLTRRIYGYRSAADFLDIGTPERLAKAEQFVLRRFDHNEAV